MHWVFIAIGVGFGATALFHIASILDASLAPGAPPWRHALFALVNSLVGVGLVRRPCGFTRAFALLTAQQVVSHGRDLYEAWTWQARIDVPSVIVLVAMPLVLVLLVRDRRARPFAPETAKPRSS